MSGPVEKTEYIKFFTEVAFESLMSKYNKTYKDKKEEAERFEIYKNNIKRIKEHNMLYENNETTYLLKENEFSDMTWYEFQATLGLRIPLDFDTTKRLKEHQTIPCNKRRLI